MVGGEKNYVEETKRGFFKRGGKHYEENDWMLWFGLRKV